MYIVKTRPLSSRAPSRCYRVVISALLGLLVSAHGAARGQREWVLRHDGAFVRTTAMRAAKPGLTVTLGLGTAHAVASGLACILLLVAYISSRRWLALPALLLTVCDLQGDISDAILAVLILMLHSGLTSALAYGLFASMVVALELYLWLGVLSWYERGLEAQIKELDIRVRERFAPSAASSVSSIMS